MQFVGGVMQSFDRLRHFTLEAPQQIARLIGTTKPTIQAIRDRTHWNAPNIRPKDPVLLGLCTQTDLNLAVEKARKSAARRGGPASEEGGEEAEAEQSATGD